MTPIADLTWEKQKILRLAWLVERLAGKWRFSQMLHLQENDFQNGLTFLFRMQVLATFHCYPA